jgi:hypothetical protein
MPRPHLRPNGIASINREGDLHDLADPQMTKTEQFRELLQQLIDEADRQLILLVDRHSTHHHAAVEAWGEKHQDQLAVVFRPRYAPERNNAKAAGLPNTKAEWCGPVEGFRSKLTSCPSMG